MSYIQIALYVVAGFLLIYGLNLRDKEKKRNAIGKSASATVVKCNKTGTGLLPEYQVVLAYKVNGKKYKANIHTRYIQSLKEGKQVSIGYNVQRPEHIQLRGNSGSKTFFIISAAIVIITNIIVSFL